MARELTIVYGTLSMGGASTSYLLDGKYTQDGAPGSRSISWRVMVKGTSKADFDTKCKALQTEFRTRYLDLSIDFDGNTHVDSSTDGFLTEAASAKRVEVATTGLTRIYECTVSYRMPLEDSDDRLSAKVTVSEDSSKIRTLRISGQWMAAAVGGSARSNAASKVPTFAATVLPSGTWDAGLIEITTDHEDKIADATWVQTEIRYGELTNSPADNASILRYALAFDVSRSHDAQSPGKNATPLATITARWSCGVDATASTSLASLYTSSIRPFIFSEIARLFPSAGAALVNEAPSYAKSGNRIEANLSFSADLAGAGVYLYQVTQQYQTPPGRFIVGVWSGVPTDAHVYQGLQRATRTTTVHAEGTDDVHDKIAPVAGLGSTTSASRSDVAPKFPEDVSAEWICIDFQEDRTPLLLGDNDLDKTIQMYRSLYVVTEQYRTVPEEGDPGPPKTTDFGGGGPSQHGDGSYTDRPVHPSGQAPDSRTSSTTERTFEEHAAGSDYRIGPAG